MELIILAFGQVDDDVRDALTSGEEVAWREASPDTPLLDQIVEHSPHLVVLGSDAPFSAGEVRSPSSDPDDVIPVLSLDGDTDADLCADGDRIEPGVARAALRMARLRRAAEGHGTGPKSERLIHRLEHEYGRTVRDGSALSVIVLSLDDIRPSGAAYGEAALEEFVQAVMETLRRSLRHGDLIFRSGDHELVAILPGTRRAGAMTVAERLRTRAAGFVAKPRTGDDRPALPLKVTPAIGVAEAPSSNVRDADELLSRARESLSLPEGR